MSVNVNFHPEHVQTLSFYQKKKTKNEIILCHLSYYKWISVSDPMDPQHTHSVPLLAGALCLQNATVAGRGIWQGDKAISRRQRAQNQRRVVVSHTSPGWKVRSFDERPATPGGCKKRKKNNSEEERRVEIEKWPWTRKGRERLAAAAGASCVSSVILPGRSVIKLNDTISPSL